MKKTEMRNPNTTHIDKMSTLDMVRVINQESYNALKAVDDASEQLAKAVDAAAESISLGGRIFYIGCGTSGRLGVLDASECPPTFGVSPDTVVGIIAGGDRCLRSAAENQEDIAELGVSDLKKYSPQAIDTVVGISASGGADYVKAALEYAKSIGCTTVAVTSNPGSALSLIAHIAIDTDTGAEVVTGSTRMKAGTAQKLVLNTISTGAMIKAGYVYENLMINLKPSNIKLKARVINITMEISGMDKELCETALEANEWNIRRAVDALREKNNV